MLGKQSDEDGHPASEKNQYSRSEKKKSKNLEYFDRAYLNNNLSRCPKTLDSVFSSVLHVMISTAAHRTSK
jgi:hypothetical protein